MQTIFRVLNLILGPGPVGRQVRRAAVAKPCENLGLGAAERPASAASSA